jgi:hypothetical protein
MNGEDSSLIRQDDAEWRAMRYALGEMSSEEAASFEGLLAREQSARESVARSAGLIEQLKSANEIRPVAIAAKSLPARFNRRRRTLMAAAALATCLLIAGGLNWYSVRVHSTLESSQAGLRTSDRAVDLLAFWSEPVDARWGDDLPKAEEFQTESVAAAEPSAHDEFNLPGWLLAAVSNDEIRDPDRTSPARAPSATREN